MRSRKDIKEQQVLKIYQNDMNYTVKQETKTTNWEHHGEEGMKKGTEIREAFCNSRVNS